MIRALLALVLLASPAFADEALTKCQITSEVYHNTLGNLITQNANLTAEVQMLTAQLAEAKKKPAEKPVDTKK